MQVRILLGTAAVAVGVLLAPAPASAQPVQPSARTLVEGCVAFNAISDGESEPAHLTESEVLSRVLAAGYCAGYLKGFIGGYSARAETVEFQYCLPRGVTVDQISRVLIARLREVPQFEHIEQLPFVLATLHGVWPCSP